MAWQPGPCPSVSARSRANGGHWGSPSPRHLERGWDVGHHQAGLSLFWRLALIWCHWGLSQWLWGEWNGVLGHGQCGDTFRVGRERQEGLTVPLGPWERRQEGQKMCLEVESDKLAKVSSYSTLLSHDVTHHWKGATACLPYPGT